MTLEDKIELCSGENFWETKKYEKYGIPSLFMCDGPHGLRKQEDAADMLGVHASRPATCFPAEVTTAGSWDPELLEQIGAAIGEEAREQGVGLVLGPGVNLKRNPLCGRNFEYFSEDPYLAGKLAAGFIRGTEAQGVGTSLKHFAANSQEASRFTSDSVLDERTLRELYLTASEIAVKEGKPATVMCAYPKLNGVHCSDNKRLLTDILRTEWGFNGMAITDWGAMNDRIEGFRAGCDLNMPGGSAYMEKEVLQAVKNGTLPESSVDDSARRVLELVFRAAEALRGNTTCDYDAHHTLAKRAAIEGAVLLKNEGSILPLRQGAKIAVIGAMAKNLRYQGAGSSHINPTRLSQPLDFLPDAIYASGCDDRGDTTDALLDEARAAAEQAEVTVVFAGLPDRYESEGFDRDDMKMPVGHLRMIEAVVSANPNTVVVLLCGSAVECPWADEVKAVLYMGLPGQAGGEAAAELLYGRISPNGKLTESWSYTYEDVPSSEIYGKTADALYQEGVYVGYRYYDKADVPVRWRFGYGLSYTEFSYSDLTVNGDTVSVTVRNTGKCAGAEVAQLYMEAPQNGLHRPLRELKGFQKVFLQPGESRTVTFTLTDRSFAVWQDGWKIPAGTYAVCVGGLRAEMEKNGDVLPVPAWQKGSWYACCTGKPDQTAWEAMLGRTYTPPVLKKGSFTMDNTVMEMKDYSLIMKIMFRAVEATIAKGFGGKKDYENPEFRMLMNSSAGSPLRSMMISGGMKGGVLPGMLEMANGHFLRGIWKMIMG
ncbi:MAG TPA: glycosyl hydrolase [Lachnospiraceae bacterium]|nr:glycosyl hydrolase [Lachnospiraceae bacterium]